MQSRVLFFCPWLLFALSLRSNADGGESKAINLDRHYGEVLKRPSDQREQANRAQIRSVHSYFPCVYDLLRAPHSWYPFLAIGDFVGNYRSEDVQTCPKKGGRICNDQGVCKKASEGQVRLTLPLFISESQIRTSPPNPDENIKAEVCWILTLDRLH